MQTQSGNEKKINFHDLFTNTEMGIKIKQEMSYNTYAPPDLDLWPSEPNINRGHILVMINLHVKYEVFVMNGI